MIPFFRAHAQEKTAAHVQQVGEQQLQNQQRVEQLTRQVSGVHQRLQDNCLQLAADQERVIANVGTSLEQFQQGQYLCSCVCVPVSLCPSVCPRASCWCV